MVSDAEGRAFYGISPGGCNPPQHENAIATEGLLHGDGIKIQDSHVESMVASRESLRKRVLENEQI